MMYDWGYGNGNNGGDWGGLVMLLFTVFIVVVGIFIVRHYGMGTHMHNSTADTALDILKKRYAAGEIDKKEFEEKRSAM